MKHTALILAAVLLLAVFAGCNNTKSPDLPVKFYYPNASIVYGKEDGFLSYETREGKNKETETAINEYLRGPLDAAYLDPFPQGVSLLQYSLQNGTAYLVLSDTYGTLAGLDLTIANTCLAMTVFALTDASSISIQCENAMIDGQNAIILNRSSVLLYDSSTTTTPTESDPSAGEN